MRTFFKMFGIFVIQGLTVLLLIWAILQKPENNMFLAFAAGAALVVFILMLVIILAGAISSNQNQ